MNYLDKLPKNLIDAFAPDDGQGVVAFVGSGPSIDAGLPSWPDLLSRIAADIGALVDIETSLKRGAYAEVAEYLAWFKSEKAIQNRISEIFQNVNISSGAIHKSIVSIPFSGLITTNYDLMLSEADVNSRFDYPISHATSGLITHIRKPFVLHLHGSVADPATIVLTKSDYDRFAIGESDKIVQFVRSVFYSRIVVFIGFGFRDTNIDCLLRDMQKLGITSGWNVYALVPCVNPSSPDKVLNRNFYHRDIHPIYVKDRGDFGKMEILHFLDELRSATKDMMTSAFRLAHPPEIERIAGEVSELIKSQSDERLMESALKKVLPKTRARYLDFSTLRQTNPFEILMKLDQSELRELLIELNATRRDAKIEDALSCLPPAPQL